MEPIKNKGSSENVNHPAFDAEKPKSSASKLASSIFQKISNFAFVATRGMIGKSMQQEVAAKNSPPEDSWVIDIPDNYVIDVPDPETSSFYDTIPRMSSAAYRRFASPDTTPKELEEGRAFDLHYDQIELDENFHYTTISAPFDDVDGSEYSGSIDTFSTYEGDTTSLYGTQSRQDDNNLGSYPTTSSNNTQFSSLQNTDSGSSFSATGGVPTGLEDIRWSEGDLALDDFPEIRLPQVFAENPRPGNWFESAAVEAVVKDPRFSRETKQIAKNIQKLLGPTQEYPKEKLLRLAEIMETHPELGVLMQDFLVKALAARERVREHIIAGKAFSIDENLCDDALMASGEIDYALGLIGEKINSVDRSFIKEIKDIDLSDRFSPMNTQVHTDCMGMELLDLDFDLAGVPLTAPDFRDKFINAINANDAARPDGEKLNSSTDRMLYRVLGAYINADPEGFAPRGTLGQKRAWVERSYNDLGGINRVVREISFKPPNGPIVVAKAEIDLESTGVLLDFEESVRFLGFISSLHGLVGGARKDADVVKALIEKAHQTNGASLDRLTFQEKKILEDAIKNWNPKLDPVDQKRLMKVAVEFVYNITSEIKQAIFRA